MDKIWTREEFEEKLREKGRGYHIYHPFHVMMYEGKLTKEQLQSWVLNRFYYQIGIPQKDAAILSNCPDVEVRKQWIVRITDHDGVDDAVGGIEAWIKLGEAVGLTREDVTSLKHVSPGVRFAVDAYINFAKQRPWQESVCSSLTELFAPHIHQQRISSWPEVYPWINESGLSYFKKRLTEARRDVEQGLSVTLDYFSQSRAMQERALDILQFKLNVLWVIADSIMLASSNIKVEDRDYLRQPVF
ncbi:pyrroloquinoline-quinone synthase PqqC [Candidatus Methylopumilus universalis]|jgi:pyrroloquinoline-quinone synthase|uniref:Pyrroloquinoline-quinone synthase n=1 Tax=Candidatus Methylopumilus universalis TaxID=2588536 RepID=A0AAX1EZ80_9PROT|nr:pyrroloquinoline-quinone synthase PqqC [Candidatus Methylopumilus universalis]MCF8183299.1 pyrroloquinoline-quinone synthase PqqC [Limnohabitans sp.]GDX53748.1 pyrroloquinoline-quinone synthase [Methylophilaceae bacterium]QDC41078.1 pyrroloquinoline-quinone synthase PqqC [Candidatus Methylopumilus universalis]QDC42368.1 pyrroloquinoline-quinone synthase PqqC [Candidatus Methylopumilus universalis]QDC46051.1 pyrroloquinoline-quinone synthase PqqC [Candidatus Methylopumilus universalis]